MESEFGTILDCSSLFFINLLSQINMTKITTKNELQGAIGNVYFRNFNGKRIMQAKPTRVKQTKATKISASHFGYAVAQEKRIRREFHPILSMGRDTVSRQRLTGLLHKAFHVPHGAMPHGRFETADLQILVGWEGNTHIPFAQIVHGSFEFTQEAGSLQGTITLPAFKLSLSPLKSRSLDLLLYAVAWLPDGTVTHHPYGFHLSNNLPQEFTFTTPSFPAGTRLLLMAQWLGSNGSTALNQRIIVNSNAANPCQLVYAGIVD